MAVTYDTSRTGVGNITVGSNSNRILLAFIGVGTDGTVVSGASYNGSNLTQLATGSYGNSQSWFIFYQFAPSTGTHAVSITSSGGGGSFNSDWYVFYNAYQTAPAFSTTTGSATTSTISNSITTPTTNCDVLACVVVNSGSGSSLTASTNMSNNILPSNPRGDSVVMDHTAWAAAASAGSFTQSDVLVAVSPVGNYAFSSVTIAPDTYTPAVGPANVKTWDGITQSTGVKTYFNLATASTKTWDGIA